MLSIILPSYKEEFLNKTIEGLLLHASGDIEIIAVLDGWWVQDTVDDPRVNYLHIGKKTGMRNAINKGVALAKGDIIMKADAHCMFCDKFDEMPVNDDEIVVPRRFFLDPYEWKVMDDAPVDYEKLIIHKTRKKFHGEPWQSRTKLRKEIERDETMIFQGSMWMMTRETWDKYIGKLDAEHYGQFIQEPVELAMNIWSKGGKVILDKRYWYAHKHRQFSRSHNISREESDMGSKYALDIWSDEYEKLLKRFQLT